MLEQASRREPVVAVETKSTFPLHVILPEENSSIEERQNILFANLAFVAFQNLRFAADAIAQLPDTEKANETMAHWIGDCAFNAIKSLQDFGTILHTREIDDNTEVPLQLQGQYARAIELARTAMLTDEDLAAKREDLFGNYDLSIDAFLASSDREDIANTLLEILAVNVQNCWNEVQITLEGLGAQKWEDFQSANGSQILHYGDLVQPEALSILSELTLHDVKSPFAAIDGNRQLLVRRRKKIEKAKEEGLDFTPDSPEDKYQKIRDNWRKVAELSAQQERIFVETLQGTHKYSAQELYGLFISTFTEPAMDARYSISMNWVGLAAEGTIHNFPFILVKSIPANFCKNLGDIWAGIVDKDPSRQNDRPRIRAGMRQVIEDDGSAFLEFVLEDNACGWSGAHLANGFSTEIHGYEDGLANEYSNGTALAVIRYFTEKAGGNIVLENYSFIDPAGVPRQGARTIFRFPMELA